jgi:hypothetical protein
MGREFGALAGGVRVMPMPLPTPIAAAYDDSSDEEVNKEESGSIPRLLQAPPVAVRTQPGARDSTIVGRAMAPIGSAASICTCELCFQASHGAAGRLRGICWQCQQLRKARGKKVWRQFSKGVDIFQDSDEEVLGLCRKCALPLGEIVYHDHVSSETLHGECVALKMLDDVQENNEARQQENEIKKQALREQYDIGWKIERIPRNCGPAGTLGCDLSSPHSLCGLVFEEGIGSIRVAETMRPAASVNLEYLSLALRVRRQEGREAMFSLDPLDLSVDPHRSMQMKRFEPEWLMGTSVGEVMFQADYYLKELSMGEYEQPVVGMKSAFDFSEAKGRTEWSAREWFVIKKAGACGGRLCISH